MSAPGMLVLVQGETGGKIAWPRIVAAIALACASFGVLAAQSAEFPGWPTEWEGVRLRRAPLTPADRVCVAGFSGVSARFTEQTRSFLFRWTERPTRTLGGVTECYERAGYKVTRDPNPGPAAGWNCYLAGKTGERLRLCQTVYSENGKRWGDTEAWVSEAISDRLPGPFWAVVLSEPAR